jgi:hypothetical protein
MTVEIRELVIQARVIAEDKQLPALPPTRTLSEQEWVELVTRRVLECLREQGGRAI